MKVSLNLILSLLSYYIHGSRVGLGGPGRIGLGMNNSRVGGSQKSCKPVGLGRAGLGSDLKVDPARARARPSLKF
jgi:hypothetical protein